jgi:predicted protein tyrosine phosphatase
MDLQQINATIIHDTDQNDTVDPITQINDHLFLGQGRATAFASLLTQLGITHIVSIGRKPHQAVLDGPFKKLEIGDVMDRTSEDLVRHFPTIFEWMRKALKETTDTRIFVHCEMGCSRGATVMIAFLRANGYYESLKETYDDVKQKRPWIDPNIGFKHQLRDFFCESLS